jgi:dCTP deaminase
MHNRVLTNEIPKDGLIIYPGKIYLGHTVEIMGSDHYVPIIRGKSSVARLGLFIHVTADLIDIGSHNQWTLQMNPVQPLKIYPNMKIGQVTFWHVYGDIDLYQGKYQGSMGAIESLIHLDATEL